MGWIGLDWDGPVFGWAGLDRNTLGGIVLDRSGLGCIRFGLRFGWRFALAWSGLGWIVLDWAGLDWIGLDGARLRRVE